MENNTKNILLFVALGGGAAYAAYEYHNKHVAAETKSLRLKILNVAMEDNDITINIEILNPNSTSMEVKSFVGEMFAGGKKVADIQMFGDYVAQGNNKISVPLIAKPLRALWAAVHKLFTAGKVAVKFAGTINVNGHAIPISLSY